MPPKKSPAPRSAPKTRAAPSKTRAAPKTRAASAPPTGASRGRGRGKGKVQYTVTPIDVDGDDVPDGDLLTKYVDGKMVSQKYVPFERLKKAMIKAAGEAKTASPAASRGAPRGPSSASASASRAASAGRAPGGRVPVYRDVPQDMSQNNNPVMVSDQTGFGQYVKQGAGLALGSLAVNTVANAVGSFFSGDEE